MKYALKVFAFLILSLILVFPLISRADDAEFKKLYGEGIDLVKKGRYADAYVYFEKALRQSPSSELVRFMLNQTGDLLISEMMAKPELKDTAMRLLDLAKGARQRMVATPEEIDTWVKQLIAGGFDKRWEAINMLATIGQRSCPYLLDKLGDPDENIRTYAIQALEKINKEAVLPLIEALRSDSSLIRQNAAIVLGVLSDVRALAALKEVFENPKEIPQVKSYVAEALTRISGLNVMKMKAAKDYYYDLAEKYYYAHPSVMVNFYGEYLVWGWDRDNNKVTMREIPDFVFNEDLAENACYAALSLDPSYEPIWPLLVCVYLARYNEADSVLEVAREQMKSGAMKEEDFNKLSTDLIDSKHGKFMASLVSKPYVYAALHRALRDNSSLVAVSCIELLKKLAEPNDLPLKSDSSDKAKFKMGLPLIEALSFPDKRVKYAAAEAMLVINPDKPYAESEKVIPTINETIAEMVERVVLIIESDSETRNTLKKELTRLSCYVVETVNAEDGLANAKRFPSKDLIIINSKIANQVVFSVEILGKKQNETVYDSLREDTRTKGVPIALVGNTSDIEAAQQIFQETVMGYIATPVTNEMVKTITEKAFQSEKLAEDSKRRAEKMVRDAIESLSSLEHQNTIYPYRESIDALCSTLDKRTDNIRILASVALGKFGDAAALQPLKASFVNKGNAKEVRVKLAQAIGEILRVNPAETINQELYEALKNGLMEEDLDIQEACARALGNAKLTLIQQRELFLLKNK
ncbi:MAG: HEAT repeat domain-containing protein [Planctomycetota bacterium]